MPAPTASDHDGAGFGAWVRGRRCDLLLTQEELAERAQLAVRTVRNIECGRTGAPRAHTRRLIEDALEAAVVSDRVPTQDRSGLGSAGRIPAQLPPDVVGFVGRSGYLGELDALLTPGPTAAVCVISGMPGVGKTALAVRWAHKARARFPDGQLYADLRGFSAGAMLDPADVLRGFLEAVGEQRWQQSSACDLVGLFRSSVTGRRLLVLLDNAYDPDQVRPLLAAASDCVTIVTSRNQLGGLVAVEGARPLVVRPFSPKDGSALLAARVGDQRVQADPLAAHRIVERCGGLPLALTIVGARAALNPQFRLSALAGELDAGTVLDAVDGGEPAGDVSAAFFWSYRRLSELAARMLRVLGHLPPVVTGIEAAASAAGWPARQARRALLELTRANLVVEETPDRFAVHDLIRTYAQGRIAEVDTSTDQRQVRARTVDHYLRTAQVAAALLRPHRAAVSPDPLVPGVQLVDLTGEGDAVEWFERECDALHLLITAAQRDRADVAACRLAQALAAFLERRARWPELATVAGIALAATVRSGDAADELQALSMVGRASMRLGDHQDARECYERALRLAAEREHDAELATAHFDLAILADADGDHAASLRHVTQARHCYRSAGDEAGEAFALNAMGWDHLQLGEPELALPYCRQAIMLYRKVGNRHGQAATWDTLGLAQHLLGRHDAAIASFREGLDLVHETGDWYLQGLLLYRLGTTCETHGDHDAARRAWRHALAILEAGGDGEAQWSAGLRALVAEKLPHA